MDDVIIIIFSVCFENLADWKKEDLEKSLAEAVDSYDKPEEENKKNHVSLLKTTWQNYLSSPSRTRLNETQNG